MRGLLFFPVPVHTELVESVVPRPIETIDLEMWGRVTRRIWPLAALVLLWVTAAAGHAQSATPTPGPLPTITPVSTLPPVPTSHAALIILLHQINRHRKKHHAPPLLLDRRESACSKKHSLHMATVGHLAHDQFPADICVPFRAAAENIGYYSGDPRAALLTLDRMMMHEGPCPAPCTPTQFEQHGHYLNLINPLYRHIGIGVVVRGGVVWLTEDFTS